jgi:hypothetical protein
MSLHRLRHHGRRISKARNLHEPGSNRDSLCYTLPVGSFLEDGGDMILRNACRLSSDYMALYLRSSKFWRRQDFFSKGNEKPENVLINVTYAD